VPATFEKTITYVFACSPVSNAKARGSIPLSSTNKPTYQNNLRPRKLILSLLALWRRCDVAGGEKTAREWLELGRKHFRRASILIRINPLPRDSDRLFHSFGLATAQFKDLKKPALIPLVRARHYTFSKGMT